MRHDDRQGGIERLFRNNIGRPMVIGAGCRLDRELSRHRYLVRGCCGLFLLFAPFCHANADVGEWLLMSRHGECSEIAILEKKVADMDGIDGPKTFVRVMRERGYEVTVRDMAEFDGEAMLVDVPEKGLSLLFVKTSLCSNTN